MRRRFSAFWMIALATAVATGVTGCGGAGALHTPSSSNPPVDPTVAFTQYEAAAKPFECSADYGEMGDAASTGDFDAMKKHARVHGDVVAAWDTQLGKISFPDAAHPIVEGMRRLNASEVAGLNELAEVDVKDVERIGSVRSAVEVARASVALEGDRLRAALGHPEPPAGVAADQLEVADRTFFRDDAPVSAKFRAALAAKDLTAAKAANAIEVDAAQHWIDRLAPIDWPEEVTHQVNELRKYLYGIIEFDRRQVDVATADLIVETPATGGPTASALEDVKGVLWLTLVKLSRSGVPARC